MSDYVRAKVIRYPLDDFYENMKFDDMFELEEFFEKIDNDFEAYSSTPNTFTLENTYGNHASHIYLDYILNYEYGSDMGDYGISYELTEEQKEKLSKYVGNHMVTAIDLKEEDVTLIIDSTNCNLGVFEDGKIYIEVKTTTNKLDVDFQYL